MKSICKKCVSAIIIVLLCFSLTACEDNPPKTEYSSYYETVVTDVIKTTEESSDSKNSSEAGVGEDFEIPFESFEIPGGRPSEPTISGTPETVPSRPDFHGQKIVIMREWNAYPNGKNAAWDNFNNWLRKCEKHFNVDIIEKKWKVTLESEMLAGVKPEGHLYLIGNTGGNIYELSQKGYIASWDGAMKNTGIDMTADHYNQYSVGLNNINGKQWGIGFGFARVNGAVIYNTKLLASAGYEKTTEKDTSIQNLIDTNKWNWSKMTEIAKATTLTNASNNITQWGIAIGDEGIKGMILSNNGNLIAPNSKGKFTSHIKDNNTVSAVKQVYSWYHTDKIASAFETTSGNTRVQNFIDGKVAMLFADEDDIPQIYEKLTANDYGVAYLPKGPNAKKYVSYVASNYVYVAPECYQDMTTELLIVADRLHEWPVLGYNREDEFRDEWTRYFHSSAQYKMWHNFYYNEDMQRNWDACDNLSFDGINFKGIVNGSQNPEKWAESTHKKYSNYYTKTASKYKLTGKLK